jgi:hypothetical protein
MTLHNFLIHKDNFFLHFYLLENKVMFEVHRYLTVRKRARPMLPTNVRLDSSTYSRANNMIYFLIVGSLSGIFSPDRDDF